MPPFILLAAKATGVFLGVLFSETIELYQEDSSTLVQLPDSAAKVEKGMETKDSGGEEDKQVVGQVSIGWKGALEEQYRKAKENLETYPYVWASYILVYGGFALWTTYRWRRLRKTEDRVQALQERLRRIVEAEESAGSATSSKVEKGPSSVDKSS